MKTIDCSRLATRLTALRPPDGNEATLLQEMTRSGLLRRVSPTLAPPRFPGPSGGAESERALAHGEMVFVVVARADDTTLGFTSLVPILDAPGRGTLGPIWVRSEANTAAIVRDATFLLMQVGFETVRYHRLELMTEAHKADRTQLRQLGFRREGILRSFDCRTEAEPRDVAIWSMILPEWPRAKRRLEAAIAAATWPGHTLLPTIMPP